VACFVTTDGIAIHYELRGEGPPLYVCHGGPNGTYAYMPEDLSPLEDRFTLIYHDYRGSGGSPPAPPDTYTFDQLADDLDQLRRHLGHDRITVMAHSLGGMVALSLVACHPSAVERLILVAVSPCTAPRLLFRRTLHALGVRRTLKALRKASAYALLWSWKPEGPARRLARWSIVQTLQEGMPALRAEVRRKQQRAAVEADNALSLERQARVADYLTLLPSLACPVLVVCGSRDAVFVAAADVFRRYVPHAQIVVLPRVGHHPFIEAPTEFQRLIWTFVGMPSHGQRPT